MNELKRLNKSNNELDKKLNKEDSLIMTDMVCYIRGAGLTYKNQELIRQDLLEMALSAQERNEPFSLVVGNKYQEFCNDVIASVPKMTTKEKIVSLIDIILMCGSILGFIATVLSTDFMRILKELFSGNVVSFDISYSVYSIGINIIIGFVAVGFVQYICKTSFETSKKAEERKNLPKRKLKRFIVGGMIGVGVFAVFLILAKVGSHTLISVNLFVVLGITGIMFLLHKVISSQQ